MPRLGATITPLWRQPQADAAQQPTDVVVAGGYSLGRGKLASVEMWDAGRDAFLRVRAAPPSVASESSSFVDTALFAAAVAGGRALAMVTLQRRNRRRYAAYRARQNACSLAVKTVGFDG